MTAQSLCIFVILTLNSCTATFWNWLITNPHDLETDISSNLRHDSPVPSSSSSRPNFAVAKLHSKNSPRLRHKHHHISTTIPPTAPPPPPPTPLLSQIASISTAQLSRLDDLSSNDEPGQLLILLLLLSWYFKLICIIY
ncbi:hypothetical protein T4D_5592 [Trichinella pseudospiralis]|uniref:Uncharacterized protein n=1 Tax=Trichinella pseudospiralis TaxID=6337 RepID=A0A0V1G3L0_TRIPS|nr:hypothetical protein T4D_5592 [Trichinella pseudospiralis]